VLQRQSDRAGARAHVVHSRARLEQLQRDLHQRLRIRPWDEHTAIDSELDPAESLPAEDVRDRFSRDPPAQIGALAQEQLGVEPRCVAAGLGQPARCRSN
jgi:hypothetical protein